MFKKEYFRGFLTGIITTALISSIAFAYPLEKTIAVVYDNIKLYVDGNIIQPKDSNGNSVEPFIYNGTTYLSVRAVGQALNKEVAWDGNSKSVYIGKKLDATAVKSPAYKRPSWIGIKLPNDETLYPVVMQYQPLVDTINNICYATDATLYRILSLANYGYRIMDLGDSTYKKMIDLKDIHYSMNYTESVRFGKQNYIGYFYDKSFPAKQYEIDTKANEQKGGAVLYERECMLPIDKVLDFFEVKYDNVSYNTEKDMVVVELVRSEKLKLVSDN